MGEKCTLGGSYTPIPEHQRASESIGTPPPFLFAKGPLCVRAFLAMACPKLWRTTASLLGIFVMHSPFGFHENPFLL